MEGQCMVNEREGRHGDLVTTDGSSSNRNFLPNQLPYILSTDAYSFVISRTQISRTMKSSW